MKRSVVRLVVFLAAAGVVGLLVVDKLRSKESSAKKKKKGSSATLVTTYEVQPRELTDTLKATGTLRPTESIAVKNETAGKVVHIGFEEGERVEQGQVLLRMRSSELRARKKVQQKRIDLLETEVDRQRKVLQKGGISQQQFDATKNELEVARAELDRIRAALQKTTLRAPFAGRIGLRQISPGAILTTGTKVAELVDDQPVEVEFSVPERHASRISKGTEVRFRVHGSEEIHEATVHAVDASFDAETRTLRVRARATNPEGELRPGAYADVRTALRTLEDALMVPSAALVRSADETYVWLNTDGTAEKQPVEVGMRTEGMVQITDGLSAGDVVVTTGR
ncbi:MAG: efflux RND transporter periplasmic adaptor subunit, partial [Bradymonadaceae bacterium]